MPRQVSTSRAAEIATFLARCWSAQRNVRVSFGQSSRNTGDVIYTEPMESLSGRPFDRYRQMRANIWLSATKRRLGSRGLSSDHAFGFVLNALEVRHAELVGLREWRGMAGEVIFNYAFQWTYRPILNAVYGKPRIAEAFLQSFLFDDIKGEITEHQLESVGRACKIAKGAVGDAAGGNRDAMNGSVPQILEELELDPFATIPIAFPWSRPDIAMNPDDVKKSITKISGAVGAPKDAANAETADSSVRGEYESLLGVRTDAGQAVHDGISTPPAEDADISPIYDYDLIWRLKTKFRDWKSKWREARAAFGDEFDAESYIEDPASPFFVDSRSESSADLMMLLDHSSSIAAVQTKYKKATLALCEVLAQLSTRFSVYAFSTSEKSVVCWEIKRASQKWDVVCARRLAQIAANGSTPLAQVYSTMRPVLDAERPETLLTMTDGEPSDAYAVRSFVRRMRKTGTRMAALGLGADVLQATGIAENLKGLGYERVLAVSRLGDIPSKVLQVLGE